MSYSTETGTRATLRDQLATADVRLSVLVSVVPGGGGELSNDTGAARMDYGGARAELDPAAAQRIFAIAHDGDQRLIALAACQGYVKGVNDGLFHYFQKRPKKQPKLRAFIEMCSKVVPI